MTESLRVAYPRRNQTWLLLAFAGCLALVARPATQSPVALALLYAALTVACLSTADAARTRLLPWSVVLAAGVGAMLAARAVAGIGIPARAGLLALTLNTLAAVAEEAFFRRYLYARLLRWGAAVAVLVSALAFALVHVPGYGLAALPLDAGAGLLLSWQRWASGRWEVPAATHVFANVLSTI